MIDLHMHTEFSIDGYDAPEAFMSRAAARGLRAVSITEHGNVDSLKRARNKAEELGLEYVSGVEMGGELPVSRGPANVDILGYFVDDAAVNTGKIAERGRRAGRLRTEAFLLGLKILGVPVTLEMVRAEYPGRVSGWAVRKMLRERGFAGGRHESFVIEDKALQAAVRENPAMEDMEADRAGAREVIDAIHADGGIAMMAHPFWLTKESRGSHPPGAVWRQIEVARGVGIDGLEAVNRANDAGYAETVLSYCRSNGLPVAGGTDAHRAAGVGGVSVPYSFLQSMKDYRDNRPELKDTLGAAAIIRG